jgi:hypothetical protein
MQANNMLEVMQNFGSINQNIVFKKGRTLRTVSEARNILANIELDEEIPLDFGIYDAQELVRVMSLVEDAEIEFDQDYLSLSGNGSSIKYFYSEIDMLTQPPETLITMPKPDVTFTLTSEIQTKLKRAAAALGHKQISISSDADKVKLTITDTKNQTANLFSVVLDDGVVNSVLPPNLNINIDNLKLMQGDYNVEVSNKLISRFTHADRNLQYFIALENK